MTPSGRTFRCLLVVAAGAGGVSLEGIALEASGVAGGDVAGPAVCCACLLRTEVLTIASCGPLLRAVVKDG